MNGGYIWAFLWVPLALLVGMALACLIRLARERRKGLLTVTCLLYTSPGRLL